MKKIYTYITVVFIFFAALMTSSCTDGFAEMNTSPRNIGTVAPYQILVMASSEWMRPMRPVTAEWQGMALWLQYATTNHTTLAGMRDRWTVVPLNAGQFTLEYDNMGIYTTTIDFIAERNPQYSDIAKMARITLIARAMVSSDVMGSLIYSQGWLARRGLTDSESMNPRFDTQEELVAIWDRELREAIATLQNNLNDPNQVNARGNDRAFNGDTQRWIRAANGIRLRLASRLWYIQPDVARAIATEVLAPANAANLPSSNDDSFIFWHDRNFPWMGDWHNYPLFATASRPFMEFLVRNEDPRKGIFFRENQMSPEFIMEHNMAVIEGNRNPFEMIPLTTGRWEGSHTSPDRRGGAMPPASEALTTAPSRGDFPDDDAFRVAAIDFMTNFDWREDDLSWDRNWFAGGVATPTSGVHAGVPGRISNPQQQRLWMGHFTIGGVAGTGGMWFPVMTFADFCLLAAEFVLRKNIPSHRTAQQWYETGVRASIEQWNEVARFADIINRPTITEADIQNFLAMPEIAWDPANALEQIYAQMFVEHFKNTHEMYAVWRRTNFPSPQTSLITAEEIRIDGEIMQIPRRRRFGPPAPGTANYQNIARALEVMMQDPKFGDPQSEFGRLWWDAPIPAP